MIIKYNSNGFEEPIGRYCTNDVKYKLGGTIWRKGGNKGRREQIKGRGKGL